MLEQTKWASLGGWVLKRQSAAVEHNKMMLAPPTALELAIGTGQSQLPKDQSHRHLPNRCQALLKAALELTWKFPLSSHCSPQNSHRRMVSYAAFGNKLRPIDKQPQRQANRAHASWPCHKDSTARCTSVARKQRAITPRLRCCVLSCPTERVLAELRMQPSKNAARQK